MFRAPKEPAGREDIAADLYRDITMVELELDKILPDKEVVFRLLRDIRNKTIALNTDLDTGVLDQYG